MRRWWCCFVLMAGCAFPARSSRYACETTADCDSGRTCEDGFCVTADDGFAGIDAAVMVDSRPVDAAPDTQTLAMQCEAAGYVFVASANGHYRRSTTNTSWTNAQATCKSHLAGATHLIVLSTAQEATYMTTQTGWIGLSDAATEGSYVTVTAETGDQRPWGAGEPDTDGDCVRMDADARTWVSNCNDNRAYVCECDGRASTP